MGPGRLIAGGALVLALLGPGSASALTTGTPDARCTGNTDSSLTMLVGQREAQTFTAQHTGTATLASAQIGKTSSGGDFQLQVYSTDPSGVPSGAPLGFVPIPDASVRTSGGLVHGTFTSPVSIEAGKQYALAVTRLSGSDWTVYDLSGNPCPGQEFFSPTAIGPFAADDPGYDLYYSISVKLTNVFTVGKLKGRTLHLDLPSQGPVVVRDATQAGKASASGGRKAVLKTATVLRGPGDSKIPLALTKLGKRILREKGRLTTRPAITFTPGQGDPNTLRPVLRFRTK